jgi:hypothetical protein
MTRIEGLKMNCFHSISVYLYGHSIVLDEVSRLLNMSPTRSRNRGDVRTTKSGSSIVQNIGFWEYKIEVSSDQIPASLLDFFSRLESKNLIGQAGIEKAELDIFFPLGDDESGNGFSFEIPSRLLEIMGILGFSLVVTSR